MKKNIFTLMAILIVPVLSFCSPAAQDTLYFHAVLKTPGGNLPFQMKFYYSEKLNSQSGEIQNGKEAIPFSISAKTGDSISIRLPVFNTEIISTSPVHSNKLSGYWRDYSRQGNYVLPFSAEKVSGKNMYRFFEKPLPPKTNISGRYDAVFIDESSVDSTVGIFEQTGNYLTATFLSTTGDYRFLEGQVSADSFFLSTFDGSHAYLFKGKIHDDGTLICYYWSGKHYQAKIEMQRNENAQLPDAKKLTYLKEGYEKIDFSFPDENGNMISLADETFKNNPVVILITGSWCPNCMDEAKYMREVEEKFTATDLKIVALQFERQIDSLNFKTNMERLRKHFGIQYPLLNAGSNRNASAALPMLSRVMGFPTTIILNRRHEVVEIHTGFSGPATGEFFEAFKKEFEALLKTLLAQ